MSIHSSHDRFYGVPIRSCVTLPNDDAQGVSEKMIRAVVVEFYRRARRDAQLGPIFDAHIADWTEHLDRMTDFWSAGFGKPAATPATRWKVIVACPRWRPGTSIAGSPCLN